jgi:large subunit ribosomal protein L22
MNNNNKNKTIFKVSAKLIKISDRRLRTFAKTLIGKRISYTISYLSIQKTKLFMILYKLINSAMLNIGSQNININNIFISNINVDKGKFYKKIFTRSQGRVNYIKKKTSQISIVLKVI